MSKKKILIAGIGGVGGYFGGLLAKEYYQSDAIDVLFLSRGKNLIEIKKSGLRIRDNDNEIVVKPKLISDNATDFGFVGYILLCTKTYDLEETVSQLLPCINDDTVIIPLQNGIDSRDKISKLLPNNLITDGCVYLISRLEEPGLIVKKGNIQGLFFGIDDLEDVKLQFLRETLYKANIKAELSKQISKITWEKFIFLSATATANTYFDKKIGEILDSEEMLNLLKQLINEVVSLAIAKNINIDKDQLELVINKLKSLPHDATTSMHSDFRSGKSKTELESLTGYVVKEGKINKVNIETFELMYDAIKAD